MWLFPHFRCLPLSHCLPLGDGQRSGNAPGVHAYAGDSVVGARCWLGWTELEGGPGPQGRTGGYRKRDARALGLFKVGRCSAKKMVLRKAT